LSDQLTDAPEVVGTYLDAKTATDIDATVGCFTRDAVVHDEGRDHVGADAIRAWAEGVVTTFELTRTIREVRPLGPGTVVAVEVAGNFPGSPVVLHHHFSVDGDRITALTICP
jgi:ketosteroid isomerase-like protein